ISIVNPHFNSTVGEAGTAIEVHLGSEADARSLHVRLNGSDVTNLFAPGKCGHSGNCDMHARVSASLLQRGANTLTAEVNGPHDAAAEDRVSFNFEMASIQSAPVARLIPAVSVQAVNLPAGADEKNVNSYRILVGPGPGFPQTAYTTEGLSCGAG